MYCTAFTCFFRGQSQVILNTSNGQISIKLGDVPLVRYQTHFCAPHHSLRSRLARGQSLVAQASSGPNRTARWATTVTASPLLRRFTRVCVQPAHENLNSSRKTLVSFRLSACKPTRSQPNMRRHAVPPRVDHLVPTRVQLTDRR